VVRPAWGEKAAKVAKAPKVSKAGKVTKAVAGSKAPEAGKVPKGNGTYHSHRAQRTPAIALSVVAPACARKVSTRVAHVPATTRTCQSAPSTTFRRTRPSGTWILCDNCTNRDPTLQCAQRDLVRVPSRATVPAHQPVAVLGPELSRPMLLRQILRMRIASARPGPRLRRNAENHSSTYSATKRRPYFRSIASRHSRSWSGIEPRRSSVLLAA
jgi:hypothetical protein